MLGKGTTTWAIKTEKLSKHYPGLKAVDDLDLTVPSGVVHGFLGPNGAGKSTTLRMICGLLRPTSGRVLVEGFDPVEAPHQVKNLVGLLPEIPPLYGEMTVKEQLKFAAQLHGFKGPAASKALDLVLHMTQVEHVSHRLIGNLSKGYRQRVGIAQALIHDPKVVVLDEPTAGLDPESVVEVRRLIKQLAQGKTVIFSSHLLHEVEEICDTISIISSGRLMVQGNLQQVREQFTNEIRVSVQLMSLRDDQREALLSLPMVHSFKESRANPGVELALVLKGPGERRSELVRALVKLDLDILSVAKSDAALEQIFLTLTRSLKEQHDGN